MLCIFSLGHMVKRLTQGKAMDINLIRQLVLKGENERLEFNLKANHPEKIIREIVAFANTKGGYLMVGVSDDRKIVGLKYPEEARYEIDRALQRYCKPALSFSPVTVSTPDNRKLLIYKIPKSETLPHFIENSAGERKAYFRIGENSIQASPELCTILRQSNNVKNTAFTYGETEHKLMQILDVEQTITVDSFATKANISRKRAADILVLMVLAKVIRIHPSDTGDRFSRVPVSSSVAPHTYIY